MLHLASRSSSPLHHAQCPFVQMIDTDVTLPPNYLTSVKHFAFTVCCLLSHFAFSLFYSSVTGECDESSQAFVRRTVYWRRFWTWRDKLNQLKRQLQAAQQLRDQLLLAELRRTPIFAVLKRVTERRRWLQQREAADVLQVCGQKRRC